METIRRRGQPTIREAQFGAGPFNPAGTGAFAPGGVLSTLSDFFATSQGPDVAFTGGYQPPVAEETLTIQEFLNSLLPTDLTDPPRTDDQFRSKAPFPFWPRTDPDLPVELTPLSGMDIATGEPIGRPEQLPRIDGKRLMPTFVSDKMAFPEIDETNIGAVRGELRKLGNELDLLMASEETITPRMKALSERIGRLETVFGDLKEAKQEAKDVARDEADKQFRAGVLQDAQDREDRLRGEAEARGDVLRGEAEARADVLRQQTQQFGLLSTLLPLLLQQQQQQAQFGQTQGLAQQRFAQEQAQTRRFETERQEELQRTQDQRQQAASLIPQLFPNMEINEEILAGGIDPSLIPVLISLARLRAEQDVSGQRMGTLPTVTFAR
jgi:hypothetical protein